jgi:hypothetical protein
VLNIAEIARLTETVSFEAAGAAGAARVTCQLATVRTLKVLLNAEIGYLEYWEEPFRFATNQDLTCPNCHSRIGDFPRASAAKQSVW